MMTACECRSKASLAHKSAEALTHGWLRDQFQDDARLWTRLAAMADRQDGVGLDATGLAPEDPHF